jgi:hypothetical protein
VCANNGRLPLHFAAQGGHVNVVKALLAAFSSGAGKVSTDSDEVAPLHLACFNGHGEVVQLLLQSDPSVAFFRNGHGNLPLHSYLEGKGSLSYSVLRSLLQAHPAATADTYNGRFAYDMFTDHRSNNHTSYEMNEQCRRLLLKYYPQANPVGFADLQWRARRNAFLIVMEARQAIKTGSSGIMQSDGKSDSHSGVTVYNGTSLSILYIKLEEYCRDCWQYMVSYL